MTDDVIALRPRMMSVAYRMPGSVDKLIRWAASEVE
jgi:hypothetical protein